MYKRQTLSTVTSIEIIFGLLTSGNPKASIIGSLLVIAVADNIADSLGIHIYRETTATKKENTRMFTISNFITRLGITLTFVVLFAFLHLEWAAEASQPTLLALTFLQNQHF